MSCTARLAARALFQISKSDAQGIMPQATSIPWLHMTWEMHSTLRTASGNVHRECRSHHTPASPCHMLEERWGIKRLSDAKGFLIRDGLPHPTRTWHAAQLLQGVCQCSVCRKGLAVVARNAVLARRRESKLTCLRATRWRSDWSLGPTKE